MNADKLREKTRKFVFSQQPPDFSNQNLAASYPANIYAGRLRATNVYMGISSSANTYSAEERAVILAECVRTGMSLCFDDSIKTSVANGHKLVVFDSKGEFVRRFYETKDSETASVFCKALGLASHQVSINERKQNERR